MVMRCTVCANLAINIRYNLQCLIVRPWDCPTNSESPGISMKFEVDSWFEWRNWLYQQVLKSLCYIIITWIYAKKLTSLGAVADTLRQPLVFIESTESQSKTVIHVWSVLCSSSTICFSPLHCLSRSVSYIIAGLLVVQWLDSCDMLSGLWSCKDSSAVVVSKQNLSV